MLACLKDVIASGFDIAPYFVMILDPRPRWRNWQTRQIKDLVGVKSRGGSSPLLGISIRIDARCACTGRRPSHLERSSGGV